MRGRGPGWRRIRRSGSILLAVWAVGTAEGQAQEADSARADRGALRPFVEGGQWDKPYLTSPGGRTAVGGYAEAHFRFEREEGITDELTFLAKRFNLFTATRVSDFVRMGAELEFEEGAREIKLEFATIDLAIHPALTFRAGMILSPVGRFNLAHDSPMNEFSDRPLVSTELVGVALSEPGAGILGLIPLGETGRVTYELYGVNGFDEGVLTDSPEGLRIPAGRQNFEDNNASPAITGRISVSPALGWELGLSGHHGAYNVFQEDGLELAKRRSLSILALDFEAEPLGWIVQGEAVAVRAELPAGLEGLFQSSQRGLYVEALRSFGSGWMEAMPESYFTLGIRVDAVDFDADADGDSVRRITVGLNFRPTAETALKLDYLRGESRDAFNSAAQHAGILLSLATYF